MEADRPQFAYRRLADQLREQAEALEPNEPLPSISRLCQETGLSVKTVRKAIKVLADEGLIYTLPGMGSYRSEPPG